jgi:hypothetical protein
MMSLLEDLYQTRTNRDRNGTIPDQWNHVLLLRDLHRLISDGLVERVSSLREISTDPRDKTWYQEISTGDLYVYVDGWERGSPEFRRHTERASHDGSHLIQ